MAELVHCEISPAGDTATITLDDPAHRNALSYALTLALVDAVDRAIAAGAGAIVVTATPPVFSAGGSVDDLLEPKAPLEDMYAGFLAVAEAPVPTVAAVNGPAIGAGTNLALACDVILCSPRARFDPRWLDLGIHPGGGNLWRLRERVGRQAAAALVLFGESVDGEDAARVGLAWRCIPEGELLDTALALARKSASRPRDLVTTTKQTLDAVARVTTSAEAVALELEPQRESMTSDAFQRRLADLRAKLGRDRPDG
ncbi:MAG: Enoyl-CoA hydratase/isomerase [Actinomycetia bacterium]|nr:Enoyl-CoA hydratase/isomerase [Actinomycetes bacterium]